MLMKLARVCEWDQQQAGNWVTEANVLIQIVTNTQL